MRIAYNFFKLITIVNFLNNACSAQVSTIDFAKSKLEFGFTCFCAETNKQIPCEVLIYAEDSLINKLTFDETSISTFELPLGKIYNCCFNNLGYATKCLQFDLIKNVSEQVVKIGPLYRYRNAKIYLVKIDDLPNNLKNELLLNKPVGIIAYNELEKNFDYDREYTKKIKVNMEGIIEKVDLLNKNPGLRKNFNDLNDTIKMKNDSILAKEFMLSKKREELLKEQLLVLEKQNENDNLEKERILKEALLNEERANSSSKQKQLDLANQLRINQEQKAKELALVQQIEREQFLNEKKLNEAQIKEQKSLAISKQKELELANQEKKNKDLEIKNASVIKNALIGLALLIGIICVLLFRAFYYKKRSAKLLLEQNHFILNQKQEITDSIQYAQRIQQAILPTKASIQKALPQSFILFKPKDIVSGDFYWFQEVDDKKYIAACDCTGHGVPGALMSMVATDMLNEALVHTKKVDEILAHTNRSIKAALKQNNDDESTRDGMDLALCCFNDKTNVLHYAGAYRPLWLIRHAEQSVAAKNRYELLEYKATKAAIGGLTEDNQEFQSTEIQLQKGDTIYLSSDGYADQFSPADKKLMTKRFKEILQSIQHLSMPEQEQYLDKFITEWRGNMEQTDDVLVIGVRV